MRGALALAAVAAVVTPVAARAAPLFPHPTPREVCRLVAYDPRYDGFPLPEARRLCEAAEGQARRSLAMLGPALPATGRRWPRCEAAAAAGLFYGPRYWEELTACAAGTGF